jgi:FeS assembly SUF system protein
MFGFKKKEHEEPEAPVSPLPTQEDIIEALREVYDPEIPVNIYDLGLIYDVIIGENGHVDINMTLTTPGCPVAQTFPGTVEAAVNQVQHVDDCIVTLVWEPPWTQDCMTEAAKLQLGLL